MATKSQQAQQALSSLVRSHLVGHIAIHEEYNKGFDALLQKYGLSISNPLDIESFPAEFYEEHDVLRAQFLDAHSQNNAMRDAGAAQLPSRRVRFLRS